MNVRRVASVGSALVVGGIAAYASYSHMRHLAIEYGQDRTVATLLPVSVDGLMVVATIALGDGRQNRWSAWLAFWAGVAASVIANVLAAQPSGIARTISAWPAVAFLLVVEVLTRRGRRRAGESFAGVLPDPSPADVATEPADPWVYAEPVDVDQAAIEPVPEDVPQPVGTTPVPVARTRTAGRKPARTGTRTKGRTGRKAGTRTDVDLIAALADVPREPDGTVPVRRAAAALGTGPDRARKLLSTAGLLRTEPPDGEPVEQVANGVPVPELLDAR